MPRLVSPTATCPAIARLWGSVVAPETSTDTTATSVCWAIGSTWSKRLSAGSASPVTGASTVLTSSVRPVGRVAAIRTRTVRVRTSPTATSTGGQVTTPSTARPSSLAVKKVTADGNVSVSTTPVAGWKPRFSSVIV